MLHISILDYDREGKDCFEEFTIPRYSNSLFGMFSGEETNVTLECTNKIVGVILDRFGKDVSPIPTDDENFQVKVHVTVSSQFMRWVFAMGEDIRIVSPESVVKQMKDQLKRPGYSMDR